MSNIDLKEKEDAEMMDEDQKDDLNKSTIDDKNKNSKFCE